MAEPIPEGSRPEWRTITVTEANGFGPLQTGFEFRLTKGYTALVGPNNAGKSAILQWIHRTLIRDDEFSAHGVCFLPPDRHYIAENFQGGARSLSDWNSDLANQTNSTDLLRYDSQRLNVPELSRLLVGNNLVRQLQDVTTALARLGFGDFTVGGRQVPRLDEIEVTMNGSGTRALLPIVCALTDPSLRAILIDEPEISLEPTLQKALRDLLVEAAHGRAVVVSTHSHLFTVREPLDATQIVERHGGQVKARAVATPFELMDVVFRLLGNSTEDLFFPRNYVIVEGASDQTYVECALELLCVAPGTIKVLAAPGIDAVGDTIVAVERALRPLLAGSSPYARTAVALIDKPPKSREPLASEIARSLGDRFFELDEPAVESYLPDDLYVRAGLARQEVLDEIKRLGDDYKAKSAVKADVAKKITMNMDAGDLSMIPTIRDAARRAAEAVDALPS